MNTQVMSQMYKKRIPDDSNDLSIALIICAGIICALHVGKASIAIPQMHELYHWSLSSLSWIMSVFSIVGMIGGIFVGSLVQKWGDKRLFCIGLAILAGGSLLGAITTNFSFLITTRVIEGLGFLLVLVSAPSMLNRLTPKSKYNIVFGFWSMFMGIGIAISIFLGPFLNSWQSLWLINAGLTFFILFIIIFKVPNTEINNSNFAKNISLKKDILKVFKSRNPFLLAISFTAYNIIFFSVFTFLPLFLINRMGISASQSGVVCGAVILSSIVGNIGSSILLNRDIEAKKIIIFSNIFIGVLGIGIFLPFTPNILAILLCFLFSIISGLIPATIVSLAPLSSPDKNLISLCIGLVMQGNYLGLVIGPLAIGLAISFSGWTAAIIPVVIFAIIGSLSSLLLKLKKE